jgi:hypothetical protein
MYEPMARNCASFVISLRKNNCSDIPQVRGDQVPIFYIHDNSTDDEHEKKRNTGQRMVKPHLAR